jgi:four helix bundle protein
MERQQIKTYRDLIVWQKAMDMVTLVYEVTRKFPKEEMYLLTSQIRGSTVSIPSNIAEGYGRNSKNDYLRFLQIAAGSLYEMQTQLEISFRLSYLSKSIRDDLFLKSQEVERLLWGLIRKLRD